MPRLKKNISEERATAYISNRLDGLAARLAATMAGYSPTTKIADLDRGRAMRARIDHALAAAGIDAAYIADQLIDVLDDSKRPGARRRNCGARADMIKNLCDLMGVGRGTKW